MRAGLTAVLARFRAGQTRAFSFGDGGPDAVVLTYEEFEDIEGWDTFALPDEVVSPEVVAGRLDDIVSGGVPPVVWGENGQAEAIMMSAAQYRRMRGDHQPPPGVVDDPTRTIYASEPLPDSRPLDLDEWAAQMGPETQAVLEELRREDREGS
jgi:hypothetical protein